MNANTVTVQQIRDLRREAIHARDFLQVVICDVALDYTDELEEIASHDALDVTVKAWLGRTREAAIAECTRVIAAAAAAE